jgi:hypothetical protein
VYVCVCVCECVCECVSVWVSVWVRALQVIADSPLLLHDAGHAGASQRVSNL